MVTSIELTDGAISKWNAWFAATAKDGVKLQATTLEMLNVIEDRACSGESFVYELGQRYTLSGRPELFTLASDEVTITQEADE